jgi:RNA polymerase sigma-70 factor (ECF subfamily)
MDEQQAIAQLKQGDINGLEFLMQQYQVQAVHTAYLITGERSLAEDVTQAAFLKVAHKVAQFDTLQPFRPWFLRIVVNDAIKAARREQKNISLGEPVHKSVSNWLLDKAPRPEELAELGDLRQAVWNALRQLSPEQRAVIIQRHFLEMSEAEMTKELQKPASTVKWWLHTAREQLRKLLEPYQVSGEKHED